MGATNTYSVERVTAGRRRLRAWWRPGNIAGARLGMLFATLGGIGIVRSTPWKNPRSLTDGGTLILGFELTPLAQIVLVGFGLSYVISASISRARYGLIVTGTAGLAWGVMIAEPASFIANLGLDRSVGWLLAGSGGACLLAGWLTSSETPHRPHNPAIEAGSGHDAALPGGGRPRTASSSPARSPHRARSCLGRRAGGP